MTLEREAYRMLQDIVGPEYISEDPAVLDGYTWQFLGECMGEVGDRFLPIRPDAVVLPGNMEEVQAIVRTCNRFGVIFKAHSTGWGAHAAPILGGVQIDLRRMNRILEINEDDMYAVVEPYVIWAQLQAEAWKKGLNCCTIGAGPNCSVLASCTSMMGIGYNNLSMGYNNRNILGVEWVLPDGEILRLGSLGSGAGWISGDGPGPSLRGIVRGLFGSLGGLGVFTKCAVRLYHWGGPPELRSENIVPTEERLIEYPENICPYYLYFDTHEKREEALFKIGEAEIGYAASFVGRGAVPFLLGADNKTSVESRKTMIDIFPPICFLLMLSTNSKREFEYQKEVLERILEETGGKRIPMEEPSIRDFATLILLKTGYIENRYCFGLTGSFMPSMCGNFITRRTVSKTETLGIEIKKKYVEKGQFIDDLGEGSWGTIFDCSHMAYLENETLFDPNDKESSWSIVELQKELNKALSEKGLCMPFLSQSLVASATGVSPHDAMGPKMSNYHVWMKKIKKAFDPNCVSDPTTYIAPE